MTMCNRVCIYSLHTKTKATWRALKSNSFSEARTSVLQIILTDVQFFIKILEKSRMVIVYKPLFTSTWRWKFMEEEKYVKVAFVKSILC